jgi:hypothetical protein
LRKPLQLRASSMSLGYHLSIPPNYKQWLDQLLRTDQNRKTLATTEKIEIDGLLRLQAKHQFKNDSNLLNKALSEVRYTCFRQN